MPNVRIVHRGDAAEGLSGSVLFGILWDALVDLLGTAATAVLIRRAARRALLRSGELRQLSIDRVDEEFGYVVPESFNRAVGPPVALRDLTEELRPLLVELTGEVVLRHLANVPELRHWVPVTAHPS